MPGPPPRRFVGYLGKLKVRKVLPRGGRGPRKALVQGWPTPITFTALTELPPVPGRPVFGPVAGEEARRLMREAKRERINLGPYSKINLLKVARGERLLAWWMVRPILEYIGRVRAERGRGPAALAPAD